MKITFLGAAADDPDRSSGGNRVGTLHRRLRHVPGRPRSESKEVTAASRSTRVRLTSCCSRTPISTNSGAACRAWLRGRGQCTRPFNVDLLRVMLLDAAHIRKKKRSGASARNGAASAKKGSTPSRSPLPRRKPAASGACGRLRCDHQPAVPGALPLSRCGPHSRFGDHRARSRARTAPARWCSRVTSASRGRR